MDYRTKWSDKEKIKTPAKKEAMPVNIKALKSIKQAFDVNKLAKRCRQSIDQIFETSGGQVWATDQKSSRKYQRFCFKDNGSKILAVAHCDVVLDKPHFAKARLSDENTYFNTKFDDRLGVYTILDLLPVLGINVDWLLTEDEESANSSAELFQSEKQYNWIVEFDRRGEDAVIYDYDDFESIVEKYFHMGTGSFSDISMMEDLKACAVNIGVGYHGEHTSRCYMDVDQYTRNIARFVNMFDAEKEIYHPHTPQKYSRSVSYWKQGSNYLSYGYETWEEKELSRLNENRKDYYDKNYPQNPPSPPFDFTDVACPECDIRFRPIWVDEINEGCYCPECQKFWDWDDLEDYYDLDDDEERLRVGEEKGDNMIEEELDLNIVDATPFGKHFKNYPRVEEERGSALNRYTEIKESMNRESDSGIMEVPHGCFD